MKSTFTDAYAQLLQSLIELRKAKGITQVQLAKILGKPQSFVSNIERGGRRIDVIEFYAYVRALGSDPEAEFTALASRLPRRVKI
jgi:transcriptional regulator with XRE-family HTH domain